MVTSIEPGQVLHLFEYVQFYSDEKSIEESERRIMVQQIASYYGEIFVLMVSFISSNAIFHWYVIDLRSHRQPPSFYSIWHLLQVV